VEVLIILSSSNTDTFVYQCAVVASELVETISINLDVDGSVVGLDYRPETHSCTGNKKVDHTSMRESNE